MEELPLMVLDEGEQIGGSWGGRAESISLELDILGGPVHFCISVARRQARLSDITPLARRLSTELVLVEQKRLRSSGASIPCRKGCSACCSYLVPLSVPEVFRLREEVLAMPAQRGRAVLKSCVDAARQILEAGLEGYDRNGPAETDGRIRISRLGRWYAGLELVCPFLSGGLCALYQQRPIACREHIVTGSALACGATRADESHVVPVAVSVVQALGELTAELEGSDIEAVMLPFALPWAEENLERSERSWSAVLMVERFVELLEAMSSKVPARRLCLAPAASKTRPRWPCHEEIATG